MAHYSVVYDALRNICKAAAQLAREEGGRLPEFKISF